MKSAIVLLGYGSPDSRDHIIEYLRDVYGGREPPQRAVEETMNKYAAFNYKSPSTEILYSLRDKLEKSLPEHDIYLGFKHWKPSMRDTASAVIQKGYSDIYLVPLFPIRNKSILKSYNIPFMEFLGNNSGVNAKMINGMEEIPDLFNHWVQSLGSIYRDSGDMVIFTAHSLPYKVSEEKEYYSGFVSMAARIAESLGITHWTYAFQSKGTYGSGWLEPSVQLRLEELKTEHFRRVLTVPIGFYYDHLEVLYDLDTIFGNSVRERGLEYVRAQLPNDSDKSVNIIKKGVEMVK